MFKHNDGSPNRRTVLHSLGGTLTGSFFLDTDGFGHTDAFDGESTTGESCCRTLVSDETEQQSNSGWPAVLTELDFVTSVSFPAHNVVTLSARGPVTDGCVADTSHSRDEVCLDVGDDYDVAVFWGELDSEVSGAAVIGPYHIEDRDSEQYLPLDRDTADSWLILDADPGSVYPDAYTYFHEIGHTLGYNHTDCGIMTTAGCSGVLTDADYGDDHDATTYLTRPTVEIAKASPHLRYTPEWTPLQTAHIEELHDASSAKTLLDERATSGSKTETQQQYSNHEGQCISDAELEFAQTELDSESAEAVYLFEGWLTSSGFRKQFADEISVQPAGLYVGMSGEQSGTELAVNSFPFSTNIDRETYDEVITEAGVIPSDHPIASCPDRDNHPFCPH